MAIKVSYTPYGAVGKLAEAAGKAQQAVREQQYQFTATQQARSIAANLQAQRERIGAEMQMQDERLEQQNIQFGEEMELRNAQVQAQEAAAGFQYLNQRKSLQQQADQFEQQMAAKEKAFELQTLDVEERLNIAKQRGDLAVEQFLSEQEMIQTNVASWMELEGTVPDPVFQQGLASARMGQPIKLPTAATQGMTPYQQTSLALRIQSMQDSNLKWQMAQEEKYGEKIVAAEEEVVTRRKEWAEKQTKPFSPAAIASMEREIMDEDSITIRERPRWGSFVPFSKSQENEVQESWMQDYYLFLESKGGNSLSPTQMKQLRSVFQRGAREKGYDNEWQNSLKHYLPLIEDKFTSKRASAPPPLPQSMVSHPDSTDVMNKPIAADDIDLSALGISKFAG
jgi:hypothetical protein